MNIFQENSNIFKLLSEAVSEGIIVVNDKRIIVGSNNAAHEIFGYEQGELVGKPLHILIPQKYHVDHKTHVKVFLENREKRPMGEGNDLFGVRKNGEEFHLQVGLNPFEIYGETYVMALVMDITNRKEIEQSHLLQREALQSANNGIIITDALQEDNPIIYYNKAFQSLTGYTEEEILGKNCRFLQGTDTDKTSINDIRNAIKKGKNCQATIRNYKKDGTLFWNDLYITPIEKNGLVTHFIGIQNDVTERVNTEQERSHWGRIFNESLNEIFVFDADSLKFINMNKGAQKNIGYTLEELIELTPVDLKPQYTEVQFRKALLPLLKGNKEKIGFETLHQRKDGTTYPVEVHLQLSHFGNKQVFLAMILDITDRKDYTAALEKIVVKRTKELNNTVNQLKEEAKKRKLAEKKTKESLRKEIELNELKTKFLSLVSHEFKTPLSGILTSTSLIAKYPNAEHQEKLNKHLSTIKSKVKYLDNILTDFLSVERLESGKVSYKFTQFPLSKLINEVVYDANMLLKSGQNIRYPKDIDDVLVEFDEKILELALSNLMNNAIKYSPENTEITIQVTHQKDRITIEVIDQGIGIPEKEQKFIFNRYYRAKNALLNQGTGIGLSIAKQHLENLGGLVTFTSIENQGTTFNLQIPQTKEP
ncbi:sensor histidine kinase [Maribacter arcticus]|uniref:histidine kinase n=1 Tax=Maribacter arcticus TaxID=561365 RepID=A0A1T5CHX6_9FLAO|nr:PAS domain-containing sensor histidine kinase [Maribacter arcticus]SKB59095.1 PAS domain S-box-containing protein [Maribacter arcticus]